MMLSALTLACSTCRATTILGGGQAAEWSIFALFCIIVMVLGTVGYAMMRLAKRAQQYADPALSDYSEDESNS